MVLVELVDDELVLLPDPEDVEFAAGIAVIVTPGVSEVSTGGSLARALLTLRAKLRTPPALKPVPKKSRPSSC